MDWKFWSFIVSCFGLVITGGIGCLTWYVYTKIRFNDLHHLAIDVKEVITKLDKIENKVNGNSERISKIEGKINK